MTLHFWNIALIAIWWWYIWYIVCWHWLCNMKFHHHFCSRWLIWVKLRRLFLCGRGPKLVDHCCAFRLLLGSIRWCHLSNTALYCQNKWGNWQIHISENHLKTNLVPWMTTWVDYLCNNRISGMQELVSLGWLGWCTNIMHAHAFRRVGMVHW